MEFKKLVNNTINFGINRIIEILSLGIILVIIGILLLISFASFSPDDPNFIFPDNTKKSKIFLVSTEVILPIFFFKPLDSLLY